MIARAWKFLSTNIGFYFALFVVIWLSAWAANALLKLTFDLDKLSELGKFVMAKFITDSGLNTKWGTKTDATSNP